MMRKLFLFVGYAIWFAGVFFLTIASHCQGTQPSPTLALISAPQEASTEPWIVIVGLLGGVGGGLITILAGPWVRAHWIRYKLSLDTRPFAGHWVHLRVQNRSSYPVRGAYVYYSCEYVKADALQPLGWRIFNPPGAATLIIEDRGAFAMEQMQKNFVSLTINPGESQALLFVKYAQGQIFLASEEGHAGDYNHAGRVSLRGDLSYRILVKVVGEDCKPGMWLLTIGPSDYVSKPIKLPQEEYNAILGEFREFWNNPRK